MSGDSIQYHPEHHPKREYEQPSYEEYGNRSQDPSGALNANAYLNDRPKEEYWEDPSQMNNRRNENWPFSHNFPPSVNMMAAAASSYNERTGVRSYRYNPSGANSASPSDMANYHQHQQYPHEAFADYPHSNRNAVGAMSGDSQSLPTQSSPSSNDRQRNRTNLHHRSNSNPLADGYHNLHRSGSGEQPDSKSKRPFINDANIPGVHSLQMVDNNPYTNRYRLSQRQQQQMGYHSRSALRDDIASNSNTPSPNKNNAYNPPYQNRSRSNRSHIPPPPHHNEQGIPPQYYDSMDVDSQNIMPPPSYDEMSSQHLHQQQQLALYGYDAQYSAAALSLQQQQPSFIPPSSYGNMIVDSDPIKELRQRRAHEHNMKVFISSPSTEKEEVISPTMSSTTATTSASTCTFGSGKDSNSHMLPHPHPSEQFRGNSAGGGNRMVVVNGGVVAVSDRKQMQSQAWYERFRELKEYRDIHGNCMVPQKYEPNPSLGIWVNKQRMEYKLLQDGEKSSMTPERLSALQSIGFVWAKRKGQATWDAKYKQLKEYKNSQGDCLIPTKYAKDPALGRWVSTQREQYRLWKAGDEKSKMTVEKVRLLEEVGFVWRLQF